MGQMGHSGTRSPIGRVRAASVALIVATVACFVLSGGTAYAIKLHPTLASSFGPDGTSGTQFTELNGIAFDQAAKKVYVAGLSNVGAEGEGEIWGFDMSNPGLASPLPSFSPLLPGAVRHVGIAVDNSSTGSSGRVYLSSQEEGTNGYAVDASGAVPPGWPIETPQILGSTAVATDPEGNVSFLESTHQGTRLDIYSPDGVIVNQIAIPGVDGETKLALDSNNDLYVSGSGMVFRFAAPSYETATTFLADAGDAVAGLAVDSHTHDVYVATSTAVMRFSADGTPLETFATDTGPGAGQIVGVAIDEANGDAYVATRRRVFRYPGLELPLPTTGGASAPTDTEITLNGTVRPDGLPLTDCRFEYVTETAFEVSGFADLSAGGSAPCTPAAGSIPADSTKHAVSARIAGLSAAVPYRFRLVASNANGPNPGQVGSIELGQPRVETTGSPVLSTVDALFEGRVDPHGLETAYHFEYGSEGPCDSNPCTSTPERTAGASSLLQLVAERVEGLAPGTTYHYRLVADNNGSSAGPAFGADMTLSTRASEAGLSHGHFPGPPGSDRAYEQVSTPDSSGNPVVGAYGFADSGDRAAYQIAGGTSLSETGTLFGLYFAQRTSSGWQTQSIAPPRAALQGASWNPPVASNDLSKLAAENYDIGESAGAALFGLSPGGSPTDLWSGPVEENLKYAMSNDGSVIVAVLAGSSDPEHPVATDRQVFEITSGVPHLISFMPDGSVPSCSASIPTEPTGQSTPARSAHWVTEDGSLVYFVCGGEIYVRNLSAGETKLVSKDSCTPKFIKATPGAAFFWCGHALPAGRGSGDVYRYDTADDSLACVTCVVPGVDAEISVRADNPNVDDAPNRIAVADDGSRVYFKSPNRLVRGASANGIYRVDITSGGLAYIGAIGRSEVGASSWPARRSTQAGPYSSSAPVILGSIPSAACRMAAPSSITATTTAIVRLAVCPARRMVGAPTSAVSPALLPGNTGLEVSPGSTPLTADGTFVFGTSTPLVGADQNTPPAGTDPEAGADVYEWRDGRLLLITDGLISWAPESPPRPAG